MLNTENIGTITATSWRVSICLAQVGYLLLLCAFNYHFFSLSYKFTLSQHSLLCLSYRIVPCMFHCSFEGLEVRSHEIGLCFYILGGGLVMLDARMLRI